MDSENIGHKNVVDISIKKEMRKSYLDYAMSVIVSRALPDVRDGLKPVHRRILYAMDDLGMTASKSYRKSARVVGDVLGKYHPHGDISVYDAMVRLAQEFNTRYLLVDGHGNFGSIDGDSAAAMRYTEVRMAKISMEMLRDIEKETVDYKLNFDETLKEPEVLPSRFPNLLVNGSSGIAVGMATNIPPHNLNEVTDGLITLIDNEDASIDEIMENIKGPDFPTGAFILGTKGIDSAYRTGRGKIQLRAVAEIEENDKGRSKIIVTEIPYQVNKARLIEKVVELVRDKVIEGIADLRDESDRDGMRIVFEIKRDANPNIILNSLYKHTQMQTTFGVIMLALVDGEPRVLNLKEVLKYYLEHQIEIITRRTQFDLNKAEARAHIVEGLKIALDNIDEVIKIIRGADNDDDAKQKLMSNFSLSDIQSQAILDMRLKRLTGLERSKLDEEYNQLNKLITELRSILADRKLVLDIIKTEALEIKEKYGDKRKTRIVPATGDIDMEDMIKEEDIVITLTHYGYIKRMPEDTYKIQRRGGRGIAGLTTREDDFVENLFICSTHDTVLFFTNKGKVYSLKGYEVPDAGRQARGTAIINILSLESDEKVSAVIPINAKEYDEDSTLVFLTKKGTVKKTLLENFTNIRKSGIIAITLRDDDELISVKETDGKDEIIVVTEKGLSIRFDENDARLMGRSAMGVNAIRLAKDDNVVAMDLVKNEDEYLLVISKNGFGKKTKLSEYRTQLRGGKGIITYNITDKTGNIVSAKVVTESDEIMMITLNGTIIRLEANAISTMGRNTRGVTLMKTENGEVVAVAKYEE